MEYEKNYNFSSTPSYIFNNNLSSVLSGLKVLDIGCAEGEYLRFFGPGSVGLDLSANNVETAKSKGLEVNQMNLNNPKLLDEKFESVFMSHILEHVENPIKLLRYANDSLLQGGKLVISVPNEEGLIHLKYPYYTGDGNHLYSFSKNNMFELLKYTGFEIEHFYYDYQTAMTAKLKLDGALNLLNILPRKIKTKFAWAYWVIASKK
jgi:2-polyprenyl-3-methyl-5-hydroxy-6-metoxy-1,4-benzoquinol methylase